MYYVLCTICTMYYVLCTMYYVLCTMYYVLCTMYYVLCTMYYVYEGDVECRFIIKSCGLMQREIVEKYCLYCFLVGFINKKMC